MVGLVSRTRAVISAGELEGLKVVVTPPAARTARNAMGKTMSPPWRARHQRGRR
jgi:hypothetical protein